MIPNFSGKWKADLQRSRLLGPAPKEILVSVVHSEPELQVDMSVMVEAGAQHIGFRARTTGETARNIVLGSEWQSRLRWIGPELLIESWVAHSGRQMHFCDYWSLSPDGKRLTMEHRDDDLPGQITILERTNAA